MGGAAAPRVLAPTAATVAAMSSFQVGAAAAKGLFPELGAVGAASQRLFLGAILLLALTRPWRGWPIRAPVGPLLALFDLGGPSWMRRVAVGRPWEVG